jgi:hypothetical protein
VHQCPCHATRGSTMFDIMHHHQTPEEGPIVEGGHDECDYDLLMNYIKIRNKKKKLIV